MHFSLSLGRRRLLRLRAILESDKLPGCSDRKSRIRRLDCTRLRRRLQSQVSPCFGLAQFYPSGSSSSMRPLKSKLPSSFNMNINSPAAVVFCFFFFETLFSPLTSSIERMSRELLLLLLSLFRLTSSKRSAAHRDLLLGALGYGSFTCKQQLACFSLKGRGRKSVPSESTAISWHK